MRILNEENVNFVRVNSFLYTTEDGTIEIKKSYHRVRNHDAGFITLSTYKDEQEWTVFGLKEHHLYSFRTLNAAKDFVRKELAKR